MQPNPRIENAKKDKVAVIFDAACAVIREKGFHQARITDISNAAYIWTGSCTTTSRANQTYSMPSLRNGGRASLP